MGALAAGALAKKTGGFGGFSKPSSTGFGGSSSGFGGLSKPSSTGFGGSGTAGMVCSMTGKKRYMNDAMLMRKNQFSIELLSYDPSMSVGRLADRFVGRSVIIS